MPTLRDRTDLAALVGPRELRSLPIHNWFVYPHSFSATLVGELLDAVQTSADSHVWDPFVGAGTTLVVSRQRHLTAFGTDVLPLSVLVAGAKTSSYQPDELEHVFRHLSELILADSIPSQHTDIPFLNKAFSHQARTYATQIRQAILRCAPRSLRPFFLTALVSVYHSFGSFIRDGGWPRFTEAPMRQANQLLPDFLAAAKTMIDDVRENSSYFQGEENSCRVSLRDFRSIPRQAVFDIVLTSPPYLNKHDYTRLFAPELSLLGVSTNHDLIRLRYRTLRSHVEARPYRNRRSRLPPGPLTDLIKSVQCTAYDPARSGRLITGYFEDLLGLLTVSSTRLREKGFLVIVLSNVRFSGVTIPIDEVLTGLARLANLHLTEKWLLRRRGNSSQQMAKYGREPVGEWVLIWQKP